jgi:hypothetical protein
MSTVKILYGEFKVKSVSLLISHSRSLEIVSFTAFQKFSVHIELPPGQSVCACITFVMYTYFN